MARSNQTPNSRRSRSRSRSRSPVPVRARPQRLHMAVTLTTSGCACGCCELANCSVVGSASECLRVPLDHVTEAVRSFLDFATERKLSLWELGALVNPTQESRATAATRVAALLNTWTAGHPDVIKDLRRRLIGLVREWNVAARDVKTIFEYDEDLGDESLVFATVAV